MSTFTNTAREVEMPNGDVVVIHNAPTGGENTTSNIKKFKYDDNGHVTESTAADAEDLNLSGYSTPTTGSTDIGASDDVQTAIGKLDHQSHIDQTNILSVQSSLVGIIRNAGGKNLVKLDDLDYIKSINTQGTWRDNVYTRNSVTFTINDDGTITVNGTNDSSTISAVLNCAIIPYSEFALTGDVISGSVVDGKTEFTIRQGAPLYTVLGRSYSGSSAVISQPTEGADEVLISVIVYANQTVDNEVVKPMICTQDSWNQSHEFQPYALNNQDLTKTVENLSYANNTVIPELVNNGSKNLWDFANANVVQVQGIPTYIKTDTDITVSTSSATTQWARVCYKITLPAGNYVWRTKITNFSATSEIRIGVADSLANQDMTWYRRTQITGNGVFTVEIPNASNGDVYIEFYINFSATTAPSNTATFSENMICTKAEYDISPNYEPFALPNTDLTRMVNDLQKKAVKVYTYHVNPNESDPEDAVTYLDDATGLTPAKMGASSFSYGSWANAWFLPRPCMLKSDGTVAYYLNPNDYSKKTDGTASDIADANFDGNVMLEFPKIWVKRVNDGNGARTVSIAPVNVDGTYKCWSNINAEDKEVDHFYLPAYNGTIHSSKMRSLSGVTLNSTYAPNYARTQEVTAATANNPTGKNMWYTETWADMCLVYDLLYLMGKSLDVQRTFGQGLSSGSETAMRAYVTGTHNAKGLFYGDISGTSTAVKVLGMENLWGCRWHGVAGLINDNGTLKVKMTYGVADGSTAVGYNTTGSGYLNYGSTYGTAGYVKKMQADNTMGYKIIETAGTDATYYCDYYYVNNSQSNYALLGGSSGYGAHCGFYVYLSDGAASAYWSIGGSLSCRP